MASKFPGGARRTDLRVVHDAAAKVNASGHAEWVMSVMPRPQGWTGTELEHERQKTDPHVKRDSLVPRLRKLAREGKVVETNRTRNWGGPRDLSCTVWKLPEYADPEEIVDWRKLIEVAPGGKKGWVVVVTEPFFDLVRDLLADIKRTKTAEYYSARWPAYLDFILELEKVDRKTQGAAQARANGIITAFCNT